MQENVLCKDYVITQKYLHNKYTFNTFANKLTS